MGVIYPTLTLLLNLLCFSQAISFTSTGSTVNLNGVPYYVPPTPLTTLEGPLNNLRFLPSAAGLIPLTVVSTNSLLFSQGDLDKIVSSYAAIDDVFQMGFLESRYS